MNTQGFIPFTNIIHHGGRVSSAFLDATSGKRVRQPIVIGIFPDGRKAELSIGEARELLRGLESALYRADQFRGIVGEMRPDISAEIRQEDRQVLKASLSIVTSE